MLLVALLGWASASPIGASPDDDYHMASIWCGGGTDDLCIDGLAAGEMLVPKVLITSSSCFAFDPEKSGLCLEPSSSELVNTARGNFLGAYPPVYYAAMSVFSGNDVVSSILLMRSFNALLFVAVVTLLFYLMPVHHRGVLSWGLAITMVPLGMFLIPSVNPSSWAVLSAATLWLSLVSYFNATERRKRLAFAGIAVIATVAGAGARADSAVYAGIAIVVAVVLTIDRSRRYAMLAILPITLAVIAGAFFLTSGQSSILASEGAADEAADSTRVLLANLILLPQLWAGALGTVGLGWLDTAMPGIVWVSTLAVFFSLVFWGLQHAFAKKTVALSVVFASLVIVPLYILVKDQVVVGTGVQPRYVYPLLIMLAGVALWTRRGAVFALSKVQSVSMAALLTVANSVALHTNLRRYVTGVDAPGLNLNAGIEWWWENSLPPMTVWIISSIAFGFAMVALSLHLARESTLGSAALVQRQDADLVTLAS
ncbi:DUF2142 domain-containing protein [Homoserinimonas sp. A447]